jgi:hypothetical protein
MKKGQKKPFSIPEIVSSCRARKELSISEAELEDFLSRGLLVEYLPMTCQNKPSKRILYSSVLNLKSGTK